MRVTPISKEEADAGGGGDPFRPGDYDFTIYAAEDTLSKAGNDMLKLTLHVFDRHGEKRTVFDYILSSETGAWKARHLMESIGLVREYEQGNMEPFALQGRPGLCKVGVEPARDAYPAKNKIVDYIQSAPSTAAPVRPRAAPVRPRAAPVRPRAAPAAEAGGDLDDEIPF